MVVWFASWALICGRHRAPLAEAGGGTLAVLSRVGLGLFPCVMRPHSRLGGGDLPQVAGGKPGVRTVASMLLPRPPPSLRETKTTLGDQVPAHPHCGPAKQGAHVGSGLGVPAEERAICSAPAAGPALCLCPAAALGWPPLKPHVVARTPRSCPAPRSGAGGHPGAGFGFSRQEGEPLTGAWCPVASAEPTPGERPWGPAC